MDGVEEVDYDKLPVRHLRGKAKNANKSFFKEPDISIIGWRAFKRGKWTARRAVRDAGLRYVLDKLLEHGMAVAELNTIVDDAIENDALKE
jgi:hypothetical protein